MDRVELKGKIDAYLLAVCYLDEMCRMFGYDRLCRMTALHNLAREQLANDISDSTGLAPANKIINSIEYWENHCINDNKQLPKNETNYFIVTNNTNNLLDDINRLFDEDADI